MALSLAFLSLGSVFLGYLARDLFIGFGTNFWAGSVYFSVNQNGAQLAGEFLPLYIKRIPFFGSITSVYLVFTLNVLLSKDYADLYFVKRFVSIYRFLSFKWGFDLVYNLIINKPLFEAAYNTVFKQRDKGFLEFIGPTSVGRILSQLGFSITQFQTGRVYDYAVVRFAVF